MPHLAACLGLIHSAFLKLVSAQLCGPPGLTVVVLRDACWVWLRGTGLGGSFREEARGDEQLLLPIFSDLDPGLRGGIRKGEGQVYGQI